MQDRELLREYTERQSEAAFAELVSRHVNLVYSTAFRVVGESQLAQDVAQSVFIQLARKARSIREGNALPGWLYRATCSTAANALRGEHRRRQRETEAMNQDALHSNPQSAWEAVAPLLEEAMQQLNQTEQDAILLRFFEGKTLREAGATLGLTEDAMQKRVSRAVERLRQFFATRGVTAGVTGLVGVISANAVQAAPAGLAVTISTAAAMAGATIATTATATTIKAIAMTTLQKSLISAALVAAVGTGIYEAHQASTLRSHVQTLQQQQTPLIGQIQQMSQAFSDATNQLATLREDNARLNRIPAELLRLRGEVSVLRRAQNKSAQSTDSPPPPVDAPARKFTEDEIAAVDLGSKLAGDVLKGDPRALDKLTESARAELKRLGVTNSVRLTQLELISLTYPNPNSATYSRNGFDTVTSAVEQLRHAAASEGNQVAIEAVERAVQIPELQPHVVDIVGLLAGKGNEAALEMLLNPDKYGILPQSSVSALRLAATAGNQRALEALFAITQDANKQQFWPDATYTLAEAAESGNAAAVGALVSLSSSTNPDLRSKGLSGLKRAAANQNTNAAAALRSMGVQ